MSDKILDDLRESYEQVKAKYGPHVFFRMSTETWVNMSCRLKQETQATGLAHETLQYSGLRLMGVPVEISTQVKFAQVEIVHRIELVELKNASA